MDLSRTVSEINGDFSWKLQIYPSPYILPPLTGFPLELGIGTRGQHIEWWAYGAEQEAWDIFGRVDTIHQRDKRTDVHRTTANTALTLVSRSKNDCDLTKKY